MTDRNENLLCNPVTHAILDLPNTPGFTEAKLVIDLALGFVQKEAKDLVRNMMVGRRVAAVDSGAQKVQELLDAPLESLPDWPLRTTIEGA